MDRFPWTVSVTDSNEIEVIDTMSYYPRAEHLANLEEHADEAAEMCGRCRAAGLDPRIYRGLIGAAVALGKRPRRALAWANDVEMVEGADDLTTQLTVRQTEIRSLAGEVEAALAQARIELASAEAALTRAKNDNQRAAARARIARAEAVIADCLAALGLLGTASEQVGYALAKLIELPDHLGDTYAEAYETVRRGHVLPHDGRWLGQTA